MDTAESRHLVTKINELEEELETLKVTCQKQIEESLSKYKRIINATSEGFLELDLDFKIVDSNAAIEELLEKNKGALLDQQVDRLYDKRSIFVHFASRDHLSFEANFYASSEKTLRLLVKRSILRDMKGRLSGYLIFFTDLTELKKTKEELELVEANYRTMYKYAVQGMYQSTLEGRFLRANPAFAKTFGFRNTRELLSHPGGANSLYKNREDRQILLSTLRDHKIYTNYEVEMQRRDGKSVWALINARLAKDVKGNLFIEGILIDNSDKRFAEEKLQISRERFRHLANHDGLTDLYNTRYLYKALDKLITESKQSMEPFSLVFLDMDNFKHVVDTHGHLNGSQALKEVARTLKAELREPAFGVAYGGDEFVLVLPKTGKMGALEQIQKIRTRMKETTYLENKGLQVNISASFGIATYPDDARDREELLALADEAMFRIKSRGKDAVGLAQH